MKTSLLIAFFLGAGLLHAANPAPAAAAQTGKMSTVHLLLTGRAPNKAAPDGMAFLFLVSRAPDAKGSFTLKETRDFQLGGESYQQKTEAELGKKFEPGTMIDDAEKFFAKNPRLRALAPAEIQGATILSITIGGAKIPNDGKADVTIHVGYEKEIEPFSFSVPVPPGPRAPRPKV
jgi:hypothetical protein